MAAAVRIAFADTPEISPYWASFGDFWYEVGLAYLVAWIFNLLVVEVPRQRDLAASWPLIRRATSGLSASSHNILSRMLTDAGMNVEPLTNDRIRDATGRLQPRGTATFLISYPDGTTSPATWAQFLRYQSDEFLRRRRDLEPLLHLVDTELLTALNDVTRDPLWVQLDHILPAMPTMRNTDLQFLADALYRFHVRCTELQMLLEKRDSSLT